MKKLKNENEKLKNEVNKNGFFIFEIIKKNWNKYLKKN